MPSFESSGYKLPEELVKATPLVRYTSLRIPPADTFRRYLTREEIAEAAEIFQRKILCNIPSYKRPSVLDLAIPLAVQHEPLMHAWVSCILLATPGNPPQHRQKSVMHYDQAVSGLKSAILVNSPSDEWKRATALLCHAIELLQPVPSSHLARSHLSGALCMFGAEPEVPNSEHDTLLLEAYLIRVATNCLLQQDIHQNLPLDYMSKLLGAHRLALARDSLSVTPQNCPWLGAFGAELMDVIYRASWLIKNCPLPEGKDVGMAEVWERCTHNIEALANDNTATGNTKNAHERCIYFLACQALLATLIPDPQCSVQMLDSSIAEGLKRLEAMTRASCENNTMFWPLIIFGALSDEDWHRESCDLIISRHGVVVPAPMLTSITAFWTDTRCVKRGKARFDDSPMMRQILL